MIAYGKLISIIKLDDKISNEIISATSSERGNQIMLDLVTIGVNKDKTLMEFYYLISQLIDNPKLLKIMKVFKNGQLCNDGTHMCAYYSIYVHIHTTYIRTSMHGA